MPEELSRAFEYGIAFDASAIAGFGDEARSDLLLHPNPETLCFFPGDRKTVKLSACFPILHILTKLHLNVIPGLCSKRLWMTQKAGVHLYFRRGAGILPVQSGRKRPAYLYPLR